MITQQFRDSKNRTARQQWLSQRRSMIGASDTPAVLGVGYAGSSPWSVWESKVAELPDRETPFAWEIGLAVESAVAGLYHQLTGNEVQTPHGYSICRHEKQTWIGCSLDGTVTLDDELCPLQIKNVGQHNAAEWGACDRCSGAGCDFCGQVGRLTPLKYLVQVQHEIYVCGTTRGVLVALVGGQAIEHRTIERDDQFLATMVESLRQFWSLVQSRTPPPPDASEAASRAINRLFPTVAPGTCVALPPQSASWIAELESAKEAEKQAVSRKRAAEALLKLSIGEHEYGATEDGRYVKWERTEVGEAQITRKAHTRHMLRVAKKLPRGVEYVDERSSTDRAAIETAATGDHRDQPRLTADQPG